MRLYVLTEAFPDAACRAAAAVWPGGSGLGKCVPVRDLLARLLAPPLRDHVVPDLGPADAVVLNHGGYYDPRKSNKLTS